MLKELLAFAWPQLMQASLIEPEAEAQHATEVRDSTIDLHFYYRDESYSEERRQ
jgi:hypothetical protein